MSLTQNPQRTPLHRPDSVDAETMPPDQTMACWGDDDDDDNNGLPWSPIVHLALLGMVCMASIGVLAGIAGFIYYRWLV